MIWLRVALFLILLLSGVGYSQTTTTAIVDFMWDSNTEKKNCLLMAS